MEPSRSRASGGLSCGCRDPRDAAEDSRSQSIPVPIVVTYVRKYCRAIYLANLSPAHRRFLTVKAVGGQVKPDRHGNYATTASAIVSTRPVSRHHYLRRLVASATASAGESCMRHATRAQGDCSAFVVLPGLRVKGAPPLVSSLLESYDGLLNSIALST